MNVEIAMLLVLVGMTGIILNEDKENSVTAPYLHAYKLACYFSVAAGILLLFFYAFRPVFIRLIDLAN